MKKTLRIRNLIYFFILSFITLSGFAQMPIFKRYYIADIPGLGWLAQFYITHYIHYISAVIFIGFATYVMVDYLFVKIKYDKFSILAYTKITSIIGLIVTGTLMMIKNLSGTPFSAGFIIFLDISHLGLCMILISLTAVGLIKGQIKLFSNEITK
jgi:hypothetical protein